MLLPGHIPLLQPMKKVLIKDRWQFILKILYLTLWLFIIERQFYPLFLIQWIHIRKDHFTSNINRKEEERTEERITAANSSSCWWKKRSVSIVIFMIKCCIFKVFWSFWLYRTCTIVTLLQVMQENMFTRTVLTGLHYHVSSNQISLLL